MGPGTRNLGIPHMGAPPLGRSFRKNREFRLERSDGDT